MNDFVQLNVKYCCSVLDVPVNQCDVSNQREFHEKYFIQTILHLYNNLSIERQSHCRAQFFIYLYDPAQKQRVLSMRS